MHAGSRGGSRNLQQVMVGLAILVISVAGMVSASGQQYDPDESETDPLVLEKLEWFQDQKFGLMMHWGPYSQWGVVESWSICSEDEPWCRRSMSNYVDYVRAYHALQHTFNPVKFDPSIWAEAARYAGMRYVVFTTKHHDGFSMFDTAQTDYSITDPGTPFSTDSRSNITKEIFDAFRAEGFGTGVYFSKADWHSNDYWAEEWATPDRNVNYSIEKYPERWQRFIDFTYRQLEELMTGYGPVDILWFDGGWVRPIETLTDESRPWGGPRPQDQDIDMPRIAEMARTHQPGLIMVDRTVHGRYENYRTPEQRVPDSPPEYIWETCMTMAGSWSYNENDSYKPARQLIHLLVDIVARGGNFLLNVGPSPEGEFHPEALKRLNEIGDWMAINSAAIYSTRAIAPYKEGNICFTALSDGTVHAVYLAGEGETAPPEEVRLQAFRPREGSEVRMLGVERPLRWTASEAGVTIRIPERVRRDLPCDYAWTFALTPAK